MKYIFQANKMKAVKTHDGQWWEVEQDCVQCGKCCMDIGDAWPLTDGEGGCDFLIFREDTKLYYCSLYAHRPFGCCCNHPGHMPEYCSVKLRKVDNVDHLL